MKSTAQALADKEFGIIVDGRWVFTGEAIEVFNKYSGELMGRVCQADGHTLEKAVSAARRSADGSVPSPWERAKWLRKSANLLEERGEEVARIIAGEAGKPIRNARAEVARAVETLTVSAEEARRIAGEEIPMAAAPGAANRLGFTMRFPLGVVCAITPFNYPLNLVCHKIAPALAGGNAVVWKPASTTLITAVYLARVFEDAGVPRGFLNLVPGSGKTVGDVLLEDQRIDFYTFTGSLEVGKHIRKKIGIRRATFELGSNCAVIVHRDADLEAAVVSCIDGAFSYAGQNCDSVQRIYIHRDIYESFRDKMIAGTEQLKAGDPLDTTTQIGPMITLEAAKRARDTILSAAVSGAKVLTGGQMFDGILEPTILDNVPVRHPVVCEEVFAPIVSLFPYDDIKDAVAMVNDSHYGLQAGVFSRDLNVVWFAVKNIRVGGVMVNENSCYRVDLMPFGGAKESGIGREGPRYAIEEMTEQRLVVFNL